MKKTYLILLSLILVISLSSCKKKKFLKFNTIINIELPDDCEECFFKIHNGEKEEHYAIPGYCSNCDTYFTEDVQYPKSFDIYTYQEGESNIVRRLLDWEHVEYTVPHEKITIELLGGDRVYEKEIKIKPRKIYNWDPKNDTFEYSGEKTEKKETNTNSSNTNGSSSSEEEKNCDDDPISTKYKNKINAGSGCQPCANCAALACYKYSGVAQSIINAQIEVVKQDALFYGYAECPELY